MGRRERIRVGAGLTFSAVAVALLAASAPATAAPKPIAGKLDKPGYTVIALAADGEAATDRAKRGRFGLRPPAKSATLHLRAKDGTYAGPIVIDTQKHGRQAIMGVGAGTDLGKVEVNSRRGYARVSKEPPRKALDESRLARAKKGVPIGSGVVGRVRSKRTRGGGPGDRDLDGIPDPLDIDDDGDLVLDNLESPAAGAGASQVARAAQAGPDLGLATVRNSPNAESIVNANARQEGDPSAPAFIDEEVDRSLAELGDLIVPIFGGDETELDCRGLTYCSFPGTGEAVHPAGPLPTQLAPFPGEPGNELFDPDGDGFGNLVMQPGSGGLFHLAHGAGTDQIKTGDLLIERVTTNGVEQSFPGTMPEVLATVAALASFSDGAGSPTTVPYPVNMGSGPGNEFPIAPCPAGAPAPCVDEGDTVLTLNLWRPQRRPIGKGPERESCLDGTPPCAWVDIGGLSYQIALTGSGPQQPGWGAGACPQSSLSTTDPLLTPASLPGTDQGGGFTDLAPDRAADPGNTLTYSVNITKCIAELNAELQQQGSSQTITWPQGESRPLTFKARDYGNRVQSNGGFWFKRQ